MFLSSWLRFLRRSLTRPPRRQPMSRPRLEALENRCCPSSLAVLSTDQADYPPGTTATFHGSGFEVGESVTINIVADNGHTEALTVTDGSANDIDGAADGNFTATWVVDPNGAYLFATVTATAIGDLGSIASTTFTDGDAPPPPPLPELDLPPATPSGIKPPPFVNIGISGTNFYDANANGIADDSAVVAGWTIVLDRDGNRATTADQLTTQTDGFGKFTFSNLGPGTYIVFEGAAPSTGWIQTYGSGAYQISASSGQNFGHGDFGNLKLSDGSGGNSLGYWTNKNGQAVVFDGGTAVPELTMLNNLNLVTASGGDLMLNTSGTGSAGYVALKDWLRAANATNMAYMLSAQLAASELSCEAGLLSGSTIVDTGVRLVGFEAMIGGTAGVVTGLNVVVDGNNVTHGFITIADLQTAANAAIYLDTNCVSADFWRTYQETLKTVLDQLNNNLLQFVA